MGNPLLSSPHFFVGTDLGDYTHEQLDNIERHYGRMSQGDPVLSLCWGCDKIESIRPNTFIICFECGHVYTKRSLVKAWRQEFSIKERLRHPIWVYGKRARDIYFCQVCIHDF